MRLVVTRNNPQSGRLHGIQGLRAVAALMVVAGHAIYSLIEKAGLADSNADLANFLGAFGVRIFFIISGFIMIEASSIDYGISGSSAYFFKRRLVRIVPLYWIVTLIYAAKEVSIGHQVGLLELAKSLSFWPYEKSTGLMQPVYGLGWTLNYEIFFYVIFALTLMLSRRVGPIVLLGVLACVAAVGAGLDKDSFLNAKPLFF